MLPGALLTAFWPPSPSLADGGAGLALYVQTPDQPHSGHYVSKAPVYWQCACIVLKPLCLRVCVRVLVFVAVVFSQAIPPLLFLGVSLHGAPPHEG